MNEISPFAILNHSPPISTPEQSLKKIGQKLRKLDIENEAPTDGQTLKRFGGYNVIPHHLSVAGY